MATTSLPLGTKINVSWLHDELAKRWMVEIRGILGPRQMPGTIQEIRHLNRLITWDEGGITWEPDPRHIQLLCKHVGVTGQVTTPLVKEKVEVLDLVDEVLDSELTTAYRSNTMRMAYLAQERTDLQRATRELAKGMQAPTKRHYEMLKRAVRYLLYVPRLRLRWRRNRVLSSINVYNDTDHAGCIRTRKSTTACVVIMGNCLLMSLCRGQALIALSSGEAEYYG